MLTNRFNNALQLCFELHGTQVRKTSQIPYISHLMAVCGIVLEAGGDENAAIAALLHDAVEDQGGQEISDRIRALFGDDVADTVLFCSDTVERGPDGEKPPWRERKEAHLDHLRKLIDIELTPVQKNGILIMIADKYHNTWSTLNSVKEHGNSVYDNFRGGMDGMLWYLNEMAEILYEITEGNPFAADLCQGVAALKEASEE